MESRGIFSVVREFLCYQEYDLAKIVILGILEGLMSRISAPDVGRLNCTFMNAFFAANCLLEVVEAAPF